MVLVIVLISVAVIIVLLYVLLVKQESKGRPSVQFPPPKKAKPLSGIDGLTEERAFSPGDRFALAAREREMAMADEIGISDIYGDMRRAIQQGVDSVWSGTTGISEASRMPLMYNDVHPQTLRTVEEHISHLKKFRTEHQWLQKLMRDPAVQMSDLAKMVLGDPILTTKILRLANSPYFGMQNKIDSISHALMILGLQNIKNILYRERLLQLFPAGSSQHKDALAVLWSHSTLTSVCASYLSDLFDGLNQGTLFTLGIIHDIGKLIILGMPQAQSPDSALWDKQPGVFSIHDEDALLGVNHAVIGQMALGEWGFSDLMIRAVAMHHMPAYIDADRLNLEYDLLQYAVALFIADQMAKVFAAGYGGPALVNALSPSCRAFIDRDRLIMKVMDAAFLAQVREAVVVADTEYPRISIQTDTRTGRTGDVEGKPDIARADFNLDATTVIGRPEPGRTIGRYEISRELGRGAMGTVYLGRDPLINREVAVKTLRYGYADDEEMTEAKKRFFREAEAAGRLTHPNIVTIYDVGEYQGTAYMAMELLDGSDLVPYCRKDHLLSLDEVVKIVSTVALALDYAHSNGVIHRDIKPGNIRILKRGDIKVVDFGIARVVDTSKTQAGVIIGSPNYMSPEQIEGGDVDGRTDLFSLGVLFFELLTGEKPFTGETIASLTHHIVTRPPPPIRDMVPGISDHCVGVLEKALAKQKGDRYQTGQEMADDVMRCLAG